MYSLANQGGRVQDTGVEGPNSETTADAPTADRESEGGLVGENSAVEPDVTLVIPTKNEAAGIRSCIERAKAAFEEHDISAEIIVSDSSTDATPEIAREAGADVVMPDRTGYGYAYRYAFQRARGDLVAMGDGDTTYDFADVPALVSRLESTGADMVIGSRLEGEIKPGAMPTLHRLVGNPVLTGFLNAFYDAGVSDAHSGLRVFRRSVLEEIDLRSDGMEFASEMIMEASEADLVIEEVPITYYEREGDATIHTFRDGWRHVKFMLVNAPGYLFSVPSAAFVLTGLTMLLASLLAPEIGLTLPEFYGAIGGSLLAIAGYQIGVLALLTVLLGDATRAPEDPVTEYVLRRFTLERGLATGTALVLASAGASAFGGSLTAVQGVVVLFVGAVGVQTVFYSFFLSLLVPDRPAPPATTPARSEPIVFDETEAD